MNIFYIWGIMWQILTSSWFVSLGVAYLGLLCFTVLINLLNGD